MIPNLDPLEVFSTFCSSYKNGCRCYICNTSHRHSNCLDRFRKMNGDSKVRASHSTYSVLSNSNIRTVQPRAHYNMISRRSRSPRLGRHVDNEGSYHTDVNSGPNPDDISRSEFDFANHQEFENSTLTVEGGIVSGECHDAMQSSAEVKCPLCRGSVSGWIPAGDVRQYLDNKLRTCSHESCKFTGTYEQLREHARTAHVLTEPAHVDLSRKRAWDRLEREQEVGDVISAIRSQVPGAIIVGDYVIETRDDMSPDIDSGDDESSEWWSDQVESPDARLDPPRVWPHEALGSPSIWSDERRNLARIPQNNRVPPRFSLGSRRPLHSGWQGGRRSSTRNRLQRGFSNHHSGHRSNYRGHRHLLLDRSYVGTRDSGSGRSLNSSVVPSRRQRLRYTHRSHY
ncbi:uncharacterized protein [Zea mays]|uniref:Uncharacterized protein n=1 Tax=Zea mays TaxID=4577 RepID=A0A804UD21_MAIZE|nr:uncharacterized protein LOC100217028 isoform X2 [Zea mays]XP_008650994.1 uncharacterized protein LOC100217028 isoform X2 [Zea mays]|eukprot:XP_008650993.1 uncharacterized protein LOC100217028 isoform X2 [Zea mays]